jgi:hypothetical protein
VPIAELAYGSDEKSHSAGTHNENSFLRGQTGSFMCVDGNAEWLAQGSIVKLGVLVKSNAK